MAAIVGFGGTVAGAGPVEVGQHVLGSAFQSAAEGDDFGQRGRDVACKVLDHCSELLLCGSASGLR